jgi:hypothetical protein
MQDSLNNYKSNYYKLIVPFLFSILLISLPNNKTYSQAKSLPVYQSLLDSVKIFYGDTCCIGVGSNLIQRLYKYKQYTPVKEYLKSYEDVKYKIDTFRTIYGKTINNEKGLLLDLSRIFKIEKQFNIVNVCGIYLGSDSVTSLGLSYIILRSSPIKFNSKIYQLANFDQAFRHEITIYGNDWIKSIKLNEITSFPLK